MKSQYLLFLIQINLIIFLEVLTRYVLRIFIQSKSPYPTTSLCLSPAHNLRQSFSFSSQFTVSLFPQKHCEIFCRYTCSRYIYTKAPWSAVFTWTQCLTMTQAVNFYNCARGKWYFKWAMTEALSIAEKDTLNTI